jgi:hypothetical protein
MIIMEVRMLNISKAFHVGILVCTALIGTASAQENAAYKIEHYTMSAGRDGVTRETSYSENLYRNGSQLLFVRNTPSFSMKKDAHQHRDERHFDSSLCPQLITLKKNGEVDFTFLDLENKVRIEVPKVEFNSVGFSGSWISSYSLVDPAIFKKMTKKGLGSQADTVWYEQTNDKSFTRILWDEKNKIALDVEVSNKDGSIKKSSKSKLINMNTSSPLFASANTFKSKVISDYRD